MTDARPSTSTSPPALLHPTHAGLLSRLALLLPRRDWLRPKLLLLLTKVEQWGLLLRQFSDAARIEATSPPNGGGPQSPESCMRWVLMVGGPSLDHFSHCAPDAGGAEVAAPVAPPALVPAAAAAVPAAVAPAEVHAAVPAAADPAAAAGCGAAARWQAVQAAE
eukprot:CAMPEP_0202392504 /NCGR_PEP_ID=MMETSP1127-20130417/92410_1 /ASSEMBLY_ACC=CAM_ASM_000462 /TAXON_ID=3047 /ORGANISM="Dunaliella tertiolecta, Strain CCMP1320" /LENGTH=163 /DNA_ID=CAMNT_0048995017 /DNA_START=3701 /DNA_END=4194 /DNA_ORIENTATION=-